ncbi:hypothetical protein [Sphingomonas sp. PB4P5]|uniref:hypothetical protein n=1 Tax=Parasphingomonas puruogangriensis TaxID=3096155 RepID=UPI002FC71F76
MKVFPTRLFYFDGANPDIERRTISGGESLSGEEDLIATDGGGRVFVDFTNAYLDEPDEALAWSALGTLLDDGATPIVVPIGDADAQQRGDITTPVGGDPWWDEADFADGVSGITLSAAAALRATTLVLALDPGEQPVRPGIWFSIKHATYSHRAYKVAEIVSQNSASATIRIRPPLREATASATQVEFSDPKCVMHVDGSMQGPRTLGFAEGSVRFVEDFSGDYS